MAPRAVTGASYGDEGKGRTVDWLAAPLGPDALVVRSNGGAQAAHTVVRNGTRHVFHHFGSGTLAGARTHLSRFMVSHPILFAEEAGALGAAGAPLQVSADPRGFVTTPWDMMVNQAIELARGGKRHGSCGLGFGETVGRCEETPFALTVGDLQTGDLAAKLRAVRDEWLPARLAGLELRCDNGPLGHAASQALFDRFVEQCADFARAVAIRPDGALAAEDALIFEGAQGLLLDQHAPGFPYLTRSNTGLANIAAIAAEAGLAAVEPVYATRCYLTRHGRGPMEDERAIGRWYDVVDPTNRPNPWQESLRFGLLDPTRLADRILADLATSQLARAPSLAVTCLDQARGELGWLEEGRVVEGSGDAFIGALEKACDMPVALRFAAP